MYYLHVTYSKMVKLLLECVFFFFNSSQGFSSLPSSIQHKEIHMGAFWNGFARIYTWHFTRQLPCKAPIRCPFDVMHNAVADDRAEVCVLMTIVLTVNETNVLFRFQRLLRVCSKWASLSSLCWIVNNCDRIYFRSQARGFYFPEVFVTVNVFL